MSLEERREAVLYKLWIKCMCVLLQQHSGLFGLSPEWHGDGTGGPTFLLGSHTQSCSAVGDLDADNVLQTCLGRGDLLVLHQHMKSADILSLILEPHGSKQRPADHHIASVLNLFTSLINGQSAKACRLDASDSSCHMRYGPGPL